MLAVVASLELVLNRVVARLLHAEFLQPRSKITRVLDDAGLFFFELASVLAVILVAAAIFRIATRGTEWRPGARASLPLVGAVFLLLCGLGLMTRLPANLGFHLQLSFFFLCLLILLAVVASHGAGGAKLGAVFLFVAIAARIVPQMTARTGLTGEPTPLGQELIAYGSLAALILAGLCFLPRRTAGRLPSVATWGVVCGMAILVRRDWETAARIATYGFGVDLPLEPWGQLVVLAALASMLYATLRLLALPGTHRLRGWGLALLGLGGLQLELPGQLALAALGFLCIASSTLRSDGPVLTRELFDGLLKRAAAALGSGQVTVTGEAGGETARIDAPGDQPVRVVVSRRAGAVSEVEITVGETPPREPAFSLARRGAGKLGPHAAGARVQTDDPKFDRVFEVWDKRGAGAGLLDDDSRARMLAFVAGWLGVWPQRGVRYRAQGLPAADDALPSLVAFLREVARRTA
jgi:hypothetical protein